MKCPILFSEKNKKNISKCRLLKILPRVLSIKTALYSEWIFLQGKRSWHIFASPYHLCTGGTEGEGEVRGLLLQEITKEATSCLQKLSPFAKWQQTISFVSIHLKIL